MTDQATPEKVTEGASIASQPRLRDAEWNRQRIWRLTRYPVITLVNLTIFALLWEWGASVYDNANFRAGDVAQLEQIAATYPSRERFLTELTLDPPDASGDEAGPPLLDEDYLILSTVHSSKGQEWDAVFVLNVSDGNFPSEFSTGNSALIEEERRLLYVAMTRAKQSLQLIAPLRYHVTQQRRDGDKHVYGARSRFMTDNLLHTMEARFHGRSESRLNGLGPRTNKRLDVASRLREMW